MASHWSRDTTCTAAAISFCVVSIDACLAASQLQVAASTALSQMAVDEAQATRILACNGLGLLMGVLERHPDDTTSSVALSALVVLLMRLQDGGKLETLHVRQEHVQQLLRVLRKHAESHAVQEVGTTPDTRSAAAHARARRTGRLAHRDCW